MRDCQKHALCSTIPARLQHDLSSRVAATIVLTLPLHCVSKAERARHDRGRACRRGRMARGAHLGAVAQGDVDREQAVGGDVFHQVGHPDAQQHRRHFLQCSDRASAGV